MQISKISLVKMSRKEKNLMQNLSKGLVTTFSKETNVTVHTLAPSQLASINQRNAMSFAMHCGIDGCGMG